MVEYLIVNILDITALPSLEKIVAMGVSIRVLSLVGGVSQSLETTRAILRVRHFIHAATMDTQGAEQQELEIMRAMPKEPV